MGTTPTHGTTSYVAISSKGARSGPNINRAESPLDVTGLDSSEVEETSTSELFLIILVILL